MTRKLIIHDGRAERELVLVGTIIVGRDPSCHINDLDPLLSRRHAEFVTTTGHVTLRDLGSRNGILVNGDKAHEHVLNDGDLVQLGHLQLRYVEDQTVPVAEVVQDTLSKGAPAADAATRAVAGREASAAELADTKSHAPHEHSGHADADATRLPDRRDNDATVAPRASDHDATVAPRAKTASPAPPVAPPTAVLAHPSTDMDTTFVPGSRDLDATFAPGAPDPDATFAPGTGPRRVAGLQDFDATFVPTSVPGRAPAATSTVDAPARIVAGDDLRVTAASEACRQIFTAAPESLLGRTLSDVVAQSFQTMAAGHGSTPLTLVVERSPLDRTLTVTFTTGPHLVTAS